MKVSALRIFSLKLALFSTMLGYMAVDLFLWHGPLWGVLHGQADAQAKAAPWVAQVYGERISDDQFERYVAEQNLLRGQQECPPKQQVVMLMELARSSLLRMRARYNDKNLPDFAAAAEEEVERLASRANSPEDFEKQLSSQGYTREQFTRKLQAILKAAALLERAVSPLCEVSDADVAKHYELLKEELMLPARRPLKHIFLATLDKKPEEVEARARELLAKIESGEADFAALARQYSEDERTAQTGGDLGYVDEHFTLKELPLFGDHALPASAPALAQSRWGWHILLPGELEPERRLSLEEAAESIRTAIQSAQYELAVQFYLDEIIRESFHKKHLIIHHHAK